MIKITEVHWFNIPAGCCGIVKTQNEVNEIKFYIGGATGMDPEIDKQMIAQTGQKIDPERVAVFLLDKNPIEA